MNKFLSVVAALPLPIPLFLLAVTFIYGLLKYFFPDLPFTQEQIQYVLEQLLALFGIVLTAQLRTRGVL